VLGKIIEWWNLNDKIWNRKVQDLGIRDSIRKTVILRKVSFTTEKYTKSCETALKEMILRNIVQALLSSRNIVLESFKVVSAKF